MKASDLEIRDFVYQFLVRTGRPPAAENTAAYFGMTMLEVQAACRRLHEHLVNRIT